jgi:hypothetical protein
MKLSTNQTDTISPVPALIVVSILVTIIWAILALMFGLNVSWLQVLGGFILIDQIDYCRVILMQKRI